LSTLIWVWLLYVSRLPWNSIVSPLLRLMYCVSNRINFVEEFLISIVILLLEDWTDLVFPVYVGVVVWAKKIRIKIPRIERMKNIFSSFILSGIQLHLCL